MSKSQKWVFVLAAALAFGTACQGPVSPGSGASLAISQAPRTISGTVRGPSGQPAAGVVVIYPAIKGRILTINGKFDCAEARTDENGRYAMAREPNNHADGRVPSDITRGAILACDLDHNLAAIHEFSRWETNMDLNLQPGITLSGIVKDTMGRPVSNA